MITNSFILSLALVVLASAVSASHAQPKPQLPGDYPNKPIRMLVNSAPGTGTDVTARLVAQKLGERWGQSVIVENRTGAAGAIALEILSQAPPTGYTIGTAAMSHMTSWMTQRNALFNVRAYTPIVQLTSQAYLVVVPLSLPVNSIKELIAYAKSRPGALNYASAGSGSTAYLGMELFKSMAGVDIVHVAYTSTSQALIDVMAGRMQVQLSGVLSSVPLVKQGRLKALAVTGLKRVQSLPDLPTVSEAGVPGYEIDNMYGIMGPAGIPSAIVLALNREISQFMNTPETKNKLAADGSEAAAPNSPAEFRDNLIKQFEKWGKIILKPGSKM